MKNLEHSHVSNQHFSSYIKKGGPSACSCKIPEQPTLFQDESSNSHFFSQRRKTFQPPRVKNRRTSEQSLPFFLLLLFFQALHSFSWVRTSGRPPLVRISASVGSLDSDMEETSRLFLLENIKTTPRNSFHKSCRYTGTRNPHSKRKTSSKIY